MAYFVVNYAVTGGGHTIIQAESSDEAKEKFSNGDWEAEGDSLEHTVLEVFEKE